MSPAFDTSAPSRVHTSPGRTVLLRASNVNSSTVAHRHLGVDSSLTLQELAVVLATAFSTDTSAPWTFGRDGERLPSDLPVGDVLGSSGDGIDADWGLWQFTLDTVEVWARDSGTPLALCIGGSGNFGTTDFDISHINRELIGPETTERVLATAHPAVADVIRRAKIHDFVPLLQALDLEAESSVSEETRARVAKLPLEEGAGQDAYWVCLLALASLADEEVANTIVEATMSALGWEDDDGSELTASAIRALCADSLTALAQVGAYGQEARSAVERLDIYREALRTH